MKTMTMWMALGLVALAWTPAATAGGSCYNYGINVEVTGGDKDCSYQETNYAQYCHSESGAGAGAGAGAGGPGQSGAEAKAGAHAGGNCSNQASTNSTGGGGNNTADWSGAPQDGDPLTSNVLIANEEGEVGIAALGRELSEAEGDAPLSGEDGTDPTAATGLEG